MSPVATGALVALATAAAVAALSGARDEHERFLARRRFGPDHSLDRARLADLLARSRASSRRLPVPMAIRRVRLGWVASLLAGGRADARGDAALATWLDAVARSIRSGAGLAASLVEATEPVTGTPLETPAHELSKRISAGGSLTEALSSFGSSASAVVPGAGLASRSLRLVVAAGGAPAELVESIASTARDRSAQRAEAWALSTQARWSAGLIACAPIAFGLLVAATDPRAAGFFFGSPAGWACLLVGGALDAAGIAWMARLMRGAAG